MNKIFISYSSKDQDWVRNHLLLQLESNGLQARIDFRDFEGGQMSVLNMERAVEECAKTLLVLTPNYVQSQFTMFEAGMVQTLDPTGEKKKIVLILLEDCQLPTRLRILTYHDFRKPNERQTRLEHLIREIKKDFAALEPAKLAYPPLADEHVSIERLPYTGYELFGRQKELQTLDEAWAAAGTHVISFVAYGGVGKSTLLNKWVERLRWDNYRGAQKVFAWSFYSQGTNERVTSADKFINDALVWFGDPDPTAGSPWDKGSRLADLIRGHKTLLLLDGMEPLQSAYDFEAGAIKDPALATLITELGRRNPGLCVITTRVGVPELSRYPQTCQQIDLEKLSAEAGAMLLKVRGTQGSDEALQQATANFGFHALAINLLATYLREIPGHPIVAAAAIPDLQNVPEKKGRPFDAAQGRHPRRIMAAFADKLGKVAATELLHVLGLFSRPAELQAIAAVIAKPPIPNLTEPLTSVRDAAFLQACATLRRYKLLAPTSSHNPDTLDCHPLVREHFGEKLRQQNPAAWKAAHSRLYEYYKNLPAKELPDTLEEMEPLFAAVAHGCQAGRHQEVLDDVYYKRMVRGHTYIIHTLGAINTTISSLYCFFDTPWQKPVPELVDEGKAYILNVSGYCLKALGLFHEAAQAMKAGMEASVALKDWEGAATQANNVSELYLTLGEVQQAIIYARQSMDFAHSVRPFDAFKRYSSHTTLADALHQAGELFQAEEILNKAEFIQKRFYPDYPVLYGLAGFRLCELLLSKGQYQEVQNRTKRMWEEGKEDDDTLFDIALYQLVLGRACMMQARAEGREDFNQASDYLNQAVQGFREAGRQDYLPRGLFARAACYRSQNEFALAWADLEEAREIAERGEMRLHLADYHLEACRLEIKEQKANSKRQAEEHLNIAKEMIEQMGYGRRKPEVEALRREIENLKYNP